MNLHSTTEAKLGLRENWQQFSMLVIINAFVGGMIGLERTLLPQLAEQEFGLVAKSALLSFIVVFGLTKAITNYFTGALANKIGRKNLLVYGWLFGLPVPLILMYAPSWNYIVFANVLLGINQGLAWSSTVVMKIDLVGEKNRGLAMGINEFAGYLSIALVAFLTGWIASGYGIRPYPFLIGILFAIFGLLASIFLVKDTAAHVKQEASTTKQARLQHVFWDTTFIHSNLGAVTQAGLVNNLNDGMIWGLLPVLLSIKGFSLSQIGLIVAAYPAVWGVGQLFTGALADKYCKKTLLFYGMLLQGIAIVFFPWSTSFVHFISIAAILGLGTAVVYPTFLAAIAADTHPDQRAASMGVFRFWRDLGYAIGALLTGVLADSLGIDYAMLVVGAITILSSLVIHFRMFCRNKSALKNPSLLTFFQFTFYK
ncbi:MFS transporter [Rhodocytophaga aerolata]|uniref:MFS transporter n=1 Tax=Rhodocytophaga aerolata TaxID=455078 RepID=A0ABT8RB79_9BACT|nr:MFS transporter [Rhodocytophaga aerolata]MDO1449254.1 MFS transporter [Rhodocytophaga aerolata]